MPTLTEKVKAFEKARALAARLSKEIVYELGLTGNLPIATVQSLPASILPKKKKRAYHRRSSAAPADAAPVAVPATLTTRGTKRKRAVITDALRSRVRDLKKAGTPIKGIMKEVGISNSAVWRILADKS